MHTDKETIALYDAKAGQYAECFDATTPSVRLAGFIAALPKDSHVLDFGCGTGRDAAFMKAAGLSVDAWDASPGMARVARETYGVDVIISDFDALKTTQTYHGIWAHFSLLHASRAKMPTHLSHLKQALKPGGPLVLGLKEGTGQKRDTLGRLYTFYAQTEITDMLTLGGFSVDQIDSGSEVGMAGTNDPYFIVTAHA